MWGLNDILTHSIAYGIGEEEERAKAEKEKKKASSNWHTGTPTEKGWYLCERKKYEYRKYFVYRFKDGEWDYFLPENILRWQKIEEKEDGHTY